MTRATRTLALGGIIGPLAFILGWVVLGLRSPGYDPVSTAISELARVGRDTRPWMTLAFVVNGLGVGTLALALRRHLHGFAWPAVLVNALATLGVAAAPLGRADSGHFAFAALAYVSLALVPLLCIPAPSRRTRGLAVVSGLTTASLLICSVIGPDSLHGLFQRLGLTVGDTWLVGLALYVRRHRR